MSVIGKEYTGLNYSILLDDGQRWQNTPHNARFKIQGPDRNPSTKTWLPVDMDGNFIKDVEKKAEGYSAKDRKKIDTFIKGNSKIIQDITFGNMNIDVFKEEVLSYDDIIAGKTNITRDQQIKNIKDYQTCQKDERYHIMIDVDTHKYTIYNVFTQKFVTDKWFDSIVPIVYEDKIGKFLWTYDLEGQQDKIRLD